MTLEIDAPNANLTFNEVQGLRELEDKSLALSGHCKSGLSVLQALQDLPDSGLDHEWTLQPYCDRLRDYSDSLSALTARICSTIDLVNDFPSSFKMSMLSQSGCVLP